MAPYDPQSLSMAVYVAPMVQYCSGRYPLDIYGHLMACFGSHLPTLSHYVLPDLTIAHGL